MNPSLVIGIDIGVRNFGMVALRGTGCRDDTDWDVVVLRLWDLEKGTAPGYTGPHGHIRRLWDYLDSVAWLWAGGAVVLIEQQMQSKHACNVKALKMAQHTISYFLRCGPHVRVVEMPAKHKTQAFGRAFRLKRDRKKWTVQETERRLAVQQDVVALDWLGTFAKRDDVCDCVMMVLAYWQMREKKCILRIGRQEEIVRTAYP